MEKFHVSSTSTDRPLGSKNHVGKEKNVDASSEWIASLPPGDHINNNSVTECHLQGRWDRFGGACTHSPERQEDRITTNINFKSLTTDGYNLQITFTGRLVHSIVVNVFPTQHDTLLHVKM